MSLVSFRRRGALWGMLIALALAVPIPAGAFAFASGWEGSPCTASDWSFITSGGTVGGPYDATPVVRYAGSCAFRIPVGNGSVQSDHPAAEAIYRARFYVFPQTAGGSVVLFQARSSAGALQFSIAHDGQAGTFNAYIGATATGPSDTTIGGAPSFKWYAVEVLYQSGQKLQISVQGAGSGVALATNLQSIQSLPAGNVDVVHLGRMSTAVGNPTGAINFDAFTSTNSVTPFGRLCRGDVDNSGAVDGPDYQALTDEILRRSIAAGQPDCNEDGGIDARDRVCVAKATGGACP